MASNRIFFGYRAAVPVLVSAGDSDTVLLANSNTASADLALFAAAIADDECHDNIQLVSFNPGDAEQLSSYLAYNGGDGALVLADTTESQSNQRQTVFTSAYNACRVRRPRHHEKGIRAVWVTRFDYRTKEDVQRIIQNCADAGFNTVHFQVRGDGTAWYRSSVEPWAEQLGPNPSFDPLQEAIRAAHDRGMELHAWVNVMPGWRGTSPPRDPEQLYNKHPEWFWYDQNGKRQPLTKNFYVSVNPCLPEVRQYLVNVCREIVQQYEVDGLHMDYVRFPNEESVPWGSKTDYPRDARTVNLFRKETGKTPEADTEAWTKWRSDCITSLVRDVRRMVDEEKPKVVLSCAVCAEPDYSRKRFFQDAQRWREECLVDHVYPMNYTQSLETFNKRTSTWCPADKKGCTGVVMGVDMGIGGWEVNKQQVASATDKCGGFAAFAYANLFDSHHLECAAKDGHQRTRKEQKRQGLAAFMAGLGGVIDSVLHGGRARPEETTGPGGVARHVSAAEGDSESPERGPHRYADEPLGGPVAADGCPAGGIMVVPEAAEERRFGVAGLDGSGPQAVTVSRILQPRISLQGPPAGALGRHPFVVGRPTGPAELAPATFVTHTLQPGETLMALTRKYGCSLDAIRAANESTLRDLHLVPVGQRIRVPVGAVSKASAANAVASSVAAAAAAAAASSAPRAAPAPARAPSPPPAEQSVVVQKGDTLFGIARRLNVAIDELLAANGMDMDSASLIAPGQRIRAPAARAAPFAEQPRAVRPVAAELPSPDFGGFDEEVAWADFAPPAIPAALDYGADGIVHPPSLLSAAAAAFAGPAPAPARLRCPRAAEALFGEWVAEGEEEELGAASGYESAEEVVGDAFGARPRRERFPVPARGRRRAGGFLLGELEAEGDVLEVANNWSEAANARLAHAAAHLPRSLTGEVRTYRTTSRGGGLSAPSSAASSAPASGRSTPAASPTRAARPRVARAAIAQDGLAPPPPRPRPRPRPGAAPRAPPLAPPPGAAERPAELLRLLLLLLLVGVEPGEPPGSRQSAPISLARGAAALPYATTAIKPAGPARRAPPGPAQAAASAAARPRPHGRSRSRSRSRSRAASPSRTPLAETHSAPVAAAAAAAATATVIIAPVAPKPASLPTQVVRAGAPASPRASAPAPAAGAPLASAALATAASIAAATATSQEPIAAAALPLPDDSVLYRRAVRKPPAPRSASPVHRVEHRGTVTPQAFGPIQNITLPPPPEELLAGARAASPQRGPTGLARAGRGVYQKIWPTLKDQELVDEARRWRRMNPSPALGPEEKKSETAAN
eukprot:tig00000169_g11892.t1